MKTCVLCLTMLFAIASTHASFCHAQELTVETSSVKRLPNKLDAKHLPNAIQVHGKVISGGQPDGERGFRELRELGVKTVISVDGAKPQVALARQFGLRYVHLPHGYNGIEQERIAELAKAVRDLDGPIYVHCHHGKHRSPAAATVACVSAGLIEADLTCSILKIAGTSESYRGLFETVESARRLPDTVLNAVRSEFPELAKLPPMAEAMVELEQTYDHLKQFVASGWSPLLDHPALDPAHEALLLREHFAELLRKENNPEPAAGFGKLLTESEADAKLLEDTIHQKRLMQSIPGKLAASETLARISANCTNCHRQYRDVPLAKKP